MLRLKKESIADFSDSDLKIGEDFLTCIAFSGVYRLDFLPDSPEFETWTHEDFEFGLHSAQVQNFVISIGNIADVTMNGWLHLFEAGRVQQLIPTENGGIEGSGNLN